MRVPDNVLLERIEARIFWSENPGHVVIGKLARLRFRIKNRMKKAKQK